MVDTGQLEQAACDAVDGLAVLKPVPPPHHRPPSAPPGEPSTAHAGAGTHKAPSCVMQAFEKQRYCLGGVLHHRHMQALKASRS